MGSPLTFKCCMQGIYFIYFFFNWLPLGSMAKSKGTCLIPVPPGSMIITPYSLDLAARVIRVLGTPSQCLKAGRLGLYQLKVVPSRLVSGTVFGSTAWWFLYWPVSGRPPLITSKRPFFGHCLLEMGGHVNMSHTLNFSRAGGAIPKVHRHAHET